MTGPGGKQNGARLLLRCLEAEGVDRMWGYPGGAIMPVYDALIDSPIRHYLTRHEQGAVFAAQGFARATGRPGVCMATSGPGATNLVTGIADAFMDSIPIVAITGQVPRAMIGTDAFQEVDVLGITLPIVKHSFLVQEPEDIPRVVREAFEAALGGRSGPVLIDLPKDVGASPVDGDPLPGRATRTVKRPDRQAIEKARELLAACQRPVIYAGGGVEKAGPDAVKALRRFAETTGAPVVHTLHGLGCLPGDHPSFLGMLGMHGLRAANEAVQGSDLLFAVGVRFDDRATGKLAEFAPSARVIHVDVDSAELGKLRVPHAALRGDLAYSLDTLASALPIEAIADWRRQCGEWRARWAWRDTAAPEAMDAGRFLRRLRDLAGPEAFVVCDVGQHQMWVAQHWSFDRPELHLTSGGLGTMGFGLPAALGVQTARPDATVINVSGDGSIMMNVQELATLKRYGLPVKIVLLDNSTLGMVRQQQEVLFDNRESEIDLSDNPDFAEVARAFGLASATIESPEEIEPGIRRMLESTGPFLLHVRIERVSNVWPFVLPGASNSEMMDEESFSGGR